jgi:CheY-like chemotaxis protein
VNFINSRFLGDHFDKGRIHQVGSVDAALEHLRVNDRDGDYIILLDLNMPLKSGWDFLEEYGKQETVSPVIVLTSSIEGSDRKRAQKYPAVKNFISKPLTAELAVMIVTLRIFG